MLELVRRLPSEPSLVFTSKWKKKTVRERLGLPSFNISTTLNVYNNMQRFH